MENVKRIGGLLKVAMVGLGLLSAAAGHARGPEGRLRPLTLGGRVGYIDTAGKVVVPPRFDEGTYFVEGRAVVQLGRYLTPEGSMTGDKYGAIDEQGNLVIPAIYRHLKDFHDGRAPFMREGGPSGYLDPQGKVVLDGATGRVMPFSDGLGAVELRRDHWVFVDVAGKTVFEVPSEGDMSDPAAFSEGRLVLTVRVADGPFGTGNKVRRTWIYDRAGKRLLDLPHKFVRDRSDGLYAARDNATDRWGFLDDTGAWALPPIHDSASGFRDGVSVVSGDDHRQKFLDKAGATRCPQEPGVRLELPSEGLAAFSLEGGNGRRKVGYLDAKTCAVVIPPTWDDAENNMERFVGGVAIVRQWVGDDPQETYIDRSGQPVRPLSSAHWLEKPVPVK